MRLRKRSAALLVGAGVIFLMGTNAQAGWLLVIAALLVGAVLAGTVLPLVGLRGLHVDLRAPAETTQGAIASVDVTVTLRGRGARWGLRLRDDHLAGTETFVDVVRAGERVEIATERTAVRRGRHRTSAVQLRTAAPFGVAERRRTVVADAATLVLPAVVPLGALPFVEPVGTAEPAIRSAPRRGRGPEYLGVREYRVGDSMRHVHWPSTARHGAVMVREFEEERTRRVLIVVDTERDVPSDRLPAADVGTTERWRPTPLDRCCTAAASIATAAFAHGHGARLAAATSDGLDVIARADEPEVLRWLAELEPSGVPLGPTTGDLPPAATRGVESVVLVAPGWHASGPSIAAAAASFGAVVPRVACVVIGTGEDAASGVAADDALHDVGASLIATGAEVYPWPVGADLAAVLGGSS
ncbi:MAG TPA: DUF58 domain-containing protein [Actinomycetota bacterium]|nr:DUF58 domain-containing protein [Actinomycetota bacterium]